MIVTTFEVKVTTKVRHPSVVKVNCSDVLPHNSEGQYYVLPYSGEFSRGAYFADFRDGIQFANFEISKINFVIETKVGVVYLLARVASQV